MRGKTIYDVLGILKKSIKEIIISTIIFIILGISYSVVAKDKYQSTSSIFVGASSDVLATSEVSDILKALETISDFTLSNVVLDKVAEENGITEEEKKSSFIRSIKNNTTVKYSNTSLIININVTNIDSSLSKKYATQITNTLVTSINDERQLGNIFTGRIQVIREASTGVNVSLSRVAIIFIFTSIGLAIGLAIALFKPLIDNKFVSVADISASGNYNVIGELKYQKEIPNFLNKANIPNLNAYDKIITNLRYVYKANHSKVIMTASTIKGEMKSTSLAGIATAMTNLGYKVILIDLDLRMPSTHKIFKISKNNGVSDYILNSLSYEDIIKKTLSGVDVITAGVHVSAFNVMIILESKQLKALIEDLKEEYDYVLIDTPPIMPCTDSLIIAKMVDAIIFNVGLHSSKRNDFKSAFKNLLGSNPNILGICATKI